MPHKMVSLERKRESFDGSAEVDLPKKFFPHSMFLDGDEIGDLGLDGAKLGDERMMMVKVRVTSISSHESEGSKKKDNSLTLDLIEAAVAPEGKSKASRIFGDDDGGN